MKLRTEGVSWQEIDGELVILDLERSVYLTTNATGAFLAKRMVDDVTSDELVVELMTEYGIDRDRAQADVESFVAELADKQLLA